jgi:hypothetical protein
MKINKIIDSAFTGHAFILNVATLQIAVREFENGVTFDGQTVADLMPFDLEVVNLQDLLQISGCPYAESGYGRFPERGFKLSSIGGRHLSALKTDIETGACEVITLQEAVKLIFSKI